MTKTLILIALIALIYLYWKHHQNQSASLEPDDIIERKGKNKQTLWEAKDLDLSDNESTNSNDD